MVKHGLLGKMSRKCLLDRQKKTMSLNDGINKCRQAFKGRDQQMRKRWEAD